MRPALLLLPLIASGCVQSRPSGASIRKDDSPSPSASQGSLPRPPPSAPSPPAPAPSADPYARPPCDPAASGRAVAVAVEEARKAGLGARALAGCEGAAPVCEGPVLDDEPGPCRARVTTGEGMFVVDLRPAPVDGAPLRFEAWLAPDASVSRVFRDGTTWAASADGALLVRGQPGHAIHEHGGKPAMLGHVTMVAYNRGNRERRLSLRGGSFTSSPGSRSALDDSLLLVGSKPSAQAVIPPRSRVELSVSFAPRSAYQSWNNHFVIEAELDAGGEVLKPSSEVHVSRVEPLRPRRTP